MTLPGYLDGYQPPVDASVLVDATAWLDDPVFWPALLWSVGGSPTAVEGFDVDPADVDAMLSEMDRPDRWPVVSLHLGDGHLAHLVWRNFPDESGQDYLVTLPDVDEPVLVAALEGNFRGPALSWRELATVAAGAGSAPDAARRLLVLLPAIGDAHLPAQATEVVAGALAALGCHRRQAEIADELLAASERFWGAIEWGDRDGVPVCLGSHSDRGFGRPLAELRSIARAFQGRPAGPR
ncbi:MULTISPECIES: hypothetical protein [Polymorphospora]|uniref:Uncharacterized protein n=1 Tax=Polymorphospora lycopeni TaxID=3140240 RepID=A0ABV5D0W0_9ACTN